MKICICTTPIRPVPTAFPPLGSMAIIQSLRKIGKEAEFYNIDYFRPPDEEVEAYFALNQFDVVGISAVVSTAYKYTKFLTKLVRRVSPHTTIVVGGNMVASAEILLRQCEVDYCVMGDGEEIVQELIPGIENGWEPEEMKHISGLCFLDEHGKFCNTGYGKVPSGDEIDWPDYSILEADGSLPHFIQDYPDWYVDYGNEIPEHMRGKRSALIITTKGCVARCTFCHRFERGYRMRPIDQLKAHVNYLIDNHNVGFINIGDENFGSNKELTREIVKFFGQKGIIWEAAGVRTYTVDCETLQYWRDNGCAAVYYGIESGSQTMLDVMEKKTTVEKNLEAIRLMSDIGLFTICQLVLGMPGENDQTISETIKFMKSCVPVKDIYKGLPATNQSLNFAQALPGTPLYEYAREHGFIGRTVKEEEKYLMQISDTDAYASDHFINYTGQPLLKVWSWRHRITSETNAYYIQDVLGVRLSLLQVILDIPLRSVRYYLAKIMPKFSQVIQTPLDKRLAKILDDDGRKSNKGFRGAKGQPGYFNVKPTPAAIIFLHPVTRKFWYPLLALAVALTQSRSVIEFFKLIANHMMWSFKRLLFGSAIPEVTKSLRKVINISPPETSEEGSGMMLPLRLGR